MTSGTQRVDGLRELTIASMSSAFCENVNKVLTTCSTIKSVKLCRYADQRHINQFQNINKQIHKN